MSNRLNRDLLTLRHLLERSTNWRLTPDKWHRFGRMIDDLNGHLVTLDPQGIDAVLRQLEEVEPGSRAVTRIDGPQLVAMPPTIHTRTVEVVKELVRQIGQPSNGHPYDDKGHGRSSHVR